MTLSLTKCNKHYIGSDFYCKEELKCGKAFQSVAEATRNHSLKEIHDSIKKNKDEREIRRHKKTNTRLDKIARQRKWKQVFDQHEKYEMKQIRTLRNTRTTI